MPIIGAHLSVAGGLCNAISAAIALECGTVQLFTKNANQWKASPITSSQASEFRSAVRHSGLRYVTAHDSYLINLASPREDLYQRSIDAFTIELERAEALGLSYLVTHPGAHMGSGIEAGIARVVNGMDEVHNRCPGYRVKVLLETTAGQGTTLGSTFEELAKMLEGITDSNRVGICLDTCHIFAAGYPLGTRQNYESTVQNLDDTIGLERVKLFHLNDSVKPLGSRVDRHAGLGLGEIGLEPFRNFVTDTRFQDRPMILETPKEDDDGRAMDPVNLDILRTFILSGATHSTN